MTLCHLDLRLRRSTPAPAIGGVWLQLSHTIGPHFRNPSATTGGAGISNGAGGTLHTLTRRSGFQILSPVSQHSSRRRREQPCSSRSQSCFYLIMSKPWLWRSGDCCRQAATRFADSPRSSIADVRMPGMTGLELQGVLARRGAGCPIIFVAGQGDIRTTVRAMKAGAVTCAVTRRHARRIRP